MSYLYSNYPDGFNPGVVIRDILGVDAVPGKVLYVGNNATLLKGERAASDGNDGSFFKPLATIDAAYNLCAANRNDLIFVRPNHSETLADAASLVMDKAGVHIVGMGHGEDRPELLFATDAAAAVPVTGANNSINNFVMKCNIASQNHMLDVAALDLLVNRCEFREGSATGLSFITADTADNDSDRLCIKDCTFFAPTAGNMDNAISLAKDFKGVRIIRPKIYGDFDDAGIDVPAGGNAQVDLLIEDADVTNLLTGQHAIQINGTSNTGKIVRAHLVGDTLGTIVDAGGLEMFEVYEHDGTDQQNARLVAPFSQELVDDSSNILGVDDANNAFSSTNVAANRDGSIIERSEFVIEQMTRGVAAASIDLSAASPRTLFTIAGGPILIHFLGIKITAAASANAALLHFNSTPTVGSATVISKAACAPDLQSAAAGDWFAIAGGSADVAVKYATGTVLPDIQTGVSGGIIVDAGTIEAVMSTDDLTTGTATAYMAFTPLAAGVSVS